MTIQTIINNAVKRLKEEGKLLTPDFYVEAFCKEATKANMNVEDCKHLNRYQEMLNKDLQKDLKNYRINTTHEFVRFLISKINRTNPTMCSDTLEAQTLLNKRVLQVIEVLHNKEASELARKTIDLLENAPKPDQIDSFRQRWVNFITTYDDTFLHKLKYFGDLDSKDLKKTIEGLKEIEYSIETNSCDLEKISQYIVASLVPSIASSVNEQIADLSDRIRSNASIINDSSIESEIKSAIALRIALDKKSVRDMVEALDGVLDKLSGRLIDMIEKSDNSNTEIQKIKHELESYNERTDKNFKLAHNKLFTIALALEKNTAVLSKDLKSHNEDVMLMTRKIKSLELELEEARKEAQEDFLTKIYNRRALDQFLDLKEGEYERYERNFSIVLFDLDHFKNINDSYGHEAGDAVLVAFGKILRKECRNVDIVGRFGGEEFIAILGDTDVNGGVVFANKVREHIKRAKFMYKGSRIEVTVSAGVAERNMHLSLKDLLAATDKLLYHAKANGRDRVEFK
ncbi:diguanylate cyclase [Sulfurimonas sp. C5]|uniref:diguanylate cyclase n=1 Tax=Sulfurimonas sp. C5 TaxID=3036947 RepID=UPI002456EA1B|nr:diguanylate cyclase [Sulfurimonas sp. C5]MDH4944991.1 diguanylate cyclase [Sulfurimonas sp. C5]